MKPSNVQIPNLVVSQRVIDRMVAASRRFIQDETGEAMVGFVDPGINTGGVPTLYVLDTIAPDESAERERYSFEQGDDVQGDIFLWLSDNWDIDRKLSTHNPKWNQRLMHLGDWHKQPGFMIAPSGGDLRSAMDTLDSATPDMGDFLLVPIVTLGHPATTQGMPGNNYHAVAMQDGTHFRVDFWYIKRDVPVFFAISPAVYPADQLPTLAPYPWHIVHEKRADLEIGQLEYDGLFVSDAIQWNTDHSTPLEICFILARLGASRLLILVTQHDYPVTPPRVYVAPFQSMDAHEDQYELFSRLWQIATPVADPPGWKWDKESYLIDYVHAVEDMLGIDRPEMSPDEAAIADPVDMEDLNEDHAERSAVSGAAPTVDGNPVKSAGPVAAAADADITSTTTGTTADGNQPVSAGDPAGTANDTELKS